MSIEIVRSATWFESMNDLSTIGKILDDTVDEFISDGYRVINVETKERNGLMRFWVYLLPPNPCA